MKVMKVMKSTTRDVSWTRLKIFLKVFHQLLTHKISVNKYLTNFIFHSGRKDTKNHTVLSSSSITKPVTSRGSYSSSSERSLSSCFEKTKQYNIKINKATRENNYKKKSETVIHVCRQRLLTSTNAFLQTI